MDEAVASVEPGPTAEQAAEWLRDLPTLWALAGPDGRRLFVEAIFERIDVLGLASAEITPTPEAESRGWAAAFGDPVVLGVKVKTGRGERDSPSLTQRPGGFVLINRTARDMATRERTA